MVRSATEPYHVYCVRASSILTLPVFFPLLLCVDALKHATSSILIHIHTSCQPKCSSIISISTTFFLINQHFQKIRNVLALVPYIPLPF
ncbi:hypothetical protein BU25DRAFT_134922 [Macroventuria anomochaeta]|uniref:Uncharacterized protein n=1 Tax=Macroventuria anomochaeta TaxID=301207 RepID=A0ACB6RSE7_9PLEO|nr:uncharacterized protein BU25DRAFT_134922 [Macroventuria anomochaeta]KAF2624826.1 hypothetical protein BU25DRAFT_134922 [Macroventuria anomochaeta]